MRKTSSVLVLSVCIFPGTARAIDCQDDTFYADQDHPEASDDNSGSEEEPLETLQTLVDAVGQCVQETGETKTARVRRTEFPYREPSRFSGDSFGGVTVRYGGTSDTARLIIEGIEDERGLPVIDQELGQADDGSPLPGFFVYADYVTIRGFEITQTAAPGVEIPWGEDKLGIIVEGCHIHHLYGQENLGGVRLNNCRGCVVRSNVIHDIYSTRDGSTSNPFTDEPYDFHSGVHGFEPVESIVENNLIYHVSRGVFQKRAHPSEETSSTVRRNIFHHVTTDAYTLSVSGAGDPPVRDAEFYDNVVYASGYAVSARVAETETQSDGLRIYNNTIVDSSGIAVIFGMMGVEVFGNIRSGFRSDLHTPSEFRTLTTEGLDHGNEIAFFDCNLYHDPRGSWLLENDGDVEQIFNDFESWQGATGSGLSGSPDANSRVAEPLFADAAERDYSLQDMSPARGLMTSECGARHALDPDLSVAGAFRDGVVIGPRDDQSPRSSGNGSDDSLTPSMEGGCRLGNTRPTSLPTGIALLSWVFFGGFLRRRQTVRR